MGRLGLSEAEANAWRQKRLDSQSEDVHQEDATSARRTIFRLGVSLAFLAYLDRVCISQAAPDVMRDLHLTKIQMGYIFSAFGFTYAVFELPCGWLCDRIGARKVLTRVVLCWSLLTAATGWAWNFASMFLVRLLFGAGEAGCFPGLAKVFSIWLPSNERAVAEGWKGAMARWGGAVAPTLVVMLYGLIGWRMSFVAFGGVGLLWAAIFLRRYTDNPREHKDVNEEEIRLIEDGRSQRQTRGGKTPWKDFLASRSAWALCVQWGCHYYGFYFYLTWLPTYLQQARGFNVSGSALVAGIPLLTAGAGTLIAGFLLPPFSRTVGTANARRWVGYVSYGGAAVLLFAFTLVRSPIPAILVMSLSSFLAEMSTPASWNAAVDMGGDFAGTLAGAMNSVGQFGGSIAPVAIAYLLAASKNNWAPTFYVSAAVYLLGTICWFLLDPVTLVGAPPELSANARGLKQNA
jgi:ACS family glucarate transporter-like MFS transporter